jgi:predicted hydrocarbon binding protein
MNDRKEQSSQETAIPDTTTTYLRCITLLECAVNVFQVLLNELGLNRTLEAIRPYSNFFGLALADSAREKFGLEGSDIEAVAMPYFWAHCATSNGNCRPMEIREGRAIHVVYSCPAADIGAPAEMCVPMAHFVADGLCEAINPDYEYIFTHHLTNHDEFCRYIVKKKSDTSSLDKLGRLEEIIPVLNLSQEETESILEMIIFGYLNSFTSASIDVLGSGRTVELVAPCSRNTGLRLGSRLISSIDESNDLVAVRDKLDFLCSVFKQSGTPAMITDAGIEKEITECPFKNGGYEVCRNLEGLFRGVCEAFSPTYEFEYDRMMTGGDDACHWVVKKKSGIPREKEAKIKNSEIEEALRVLRWRLAGGEITEAEYDRLRDKLSK